MARSSGTTLTKYISATTIVTADIANSWYGGLYGTTEGNAYNSDDPLVAGHVHDGQHLDGHAQKINLVNHVTGQLRNSNLADSAVNKRNVQSFTDQGSAIPEFETILGVPHYYLDLSDLRSSIGAGSGAFSTSGGITSNSPGDLLLDDFVFGSDSLDDDGSPTHDYRMLFDKSKGAFRAGEVTGTEWDNSNRGSHSIAFGKNNIASGARTTVAGGQSTISNGTGCFVGAGQFNRVSGSHSFIGAGNTNSLGYFASIGFSSDNSAIVSGDTNTIEQNCPKTFIGAGGLNIIKTGNTNSSIVGGESNSILTGGISCFIGGGSSNEIAGVSTYSAILSGTTNGIGASSVKSAIISGNQNAVTGTNSMVGSGDSNTINSSALNSIIGSGDTNTVSANYSGILAGGSNSIGTSCHYSVILGGTSNFISQNAPANFIGAGGYTLGSPAANSIQASSGGSPGSANAIVSGYDNKIDFNGIGGNFIGAGGSNTITGTSSNFNAIVSGIDNTITSSSQAFIGGGRENTITSDSNGVIVGGGGISKGNTILSNISTDPSCFIGGGFDNYIEADDPEGAVIVGGSSNSIFNKYGVIPGGQNNLIADNADYSFVMGNYAAARSFGERAHASGPIISNIRGSAQESTFIFSGVLTGSTTADMDLYLNGLSASEWVQMQNNSLMYVVFNLVVMDKADTIYYGSKFTALIRCSSVGVTSLVNFIDDYDIIDPSAESWDFGIQVSSNTWHPYVVRDSGIPGTDRVGVCVARVTQVITAL